MSNRQALGGIRVLDFTDDLGAYASRLLSDLGAAVLRIDTPAGWPACTGEPPFEVNGGRGISLFDRFVNAGKQRVMVDPATPQGRALLARLAADADVLIESSWHGNTVGITEGFNARLIHVIVTPFGRGLNPNWAPVDDLIVLGAGGLLYLGGYQDTGPVAAYGGQSRYAASIFAAAATLVALIDRERSGRGTTIDVSAQECIAQALEDSVPTFALTGNERMRYGTVAREAGTGTYACADGYVSMVAGRLGTARAWSALVEWFNDEGAEGTEVLLDPRWSEFAYRQTDEAIEGFTRIFEGFAATRSKLAIYIEAQRRGIALSPVNEIRDLIHDPQLQDREFFLSVKDEELGATLTFPGSPYRLSLTPAVVGKKPEHLLDDSWRFTGDGGLLSDAEYESLVPWGTT
ncbi:MAG TPA: CoA transferase [Acidimicrobiia bacterium]|nr:CoA transferase [Acidimicrobiia bacterium]